MGKKKCDTLPIEKRKTARKVSGDLVHMLSQHPKPALAAADGEPSNVIKTTTRAARGLRGLLMIAWLMISDDYIFAFDLYSTFLTAKILDNFFERIIVLGAFNGLLLEKCLWIVLFFLHYLKLVSDIMLLEYVLAAIYQFIHSKLVRCLPDPWFLYLFIVTGLSDFIDHLLLSLLLSHDLGLCLFHSPDLANGQFFVLALNRSN
jgi:hypothetical protein